MWAGVDVGGRRKGFHVAVVDAARVVHGPFRARTPAAVVERLTPYRPRVVAVDSPVRAADPGHLSRADERELATRVCGILYTPERSRLAGNAYYAWIEHGFELYAALADAGFETIECFSTASWTRLYRPRGRELRARWSADALAALGLEPVGGPLQQDDRDAIAAAYTAWLYDSGATESIGDIVVPLAARS